MPFGLLISGSMVQSHRYPPLSPLKSANLERKAQSLKGGLYTPASVTLPSTPVAAAQGGNIGGNFQLTRAPWAGSLVMLELCSDATPRALPSFLVPSPERFAPGAEGDRHQLEIPSLSLVRGGHP